MLIWKLYCHWRKILDQLHGALARNVRGHPSQMKCDFKEICWHATLTYIYSMSCCKSSRDRLKEASANIQMHKRNTHQRLCFMWQSYQMSLRVRSSKTMIKHQTELVMSCVGYTLNKKYRKRALRSKLNFRRSLVKLTLMCNPTRKSLNLCDWLSCPFCHLML